jgi:hypothetical protein
MFGKTEEKNSTILTTPASANLKSLHDNYLIQARKSRGSTNASDLAPIGGVTH